MDNMMLEELKWQWEKWSRTPEARAEWEKIAARAHELMLSETLESRLSGNPYIFTPNKENK